MCSWHHTLLRQAERPGMVRQAMQAGSTAVPLTCAPTPAHVPWGHHMQAYAGLKGRRGCMNSRLHGTAESTPFSTCQPILRWQQ